MISKRPPAQTGNPPQHAASSRLSRFAPETGQLVREAIVKAENDPLIKQATEVLLAIKATYTHDIPNIYRQTLDPLRGHSCPAEKIELFSLILGRFSTEMMFDLKAGLLLNALINTSGDAGFTIHTTQLDKRLQYIGYLNDGKEITINGPAGDYAGMEMNRGSLIIHGDAGMNLGAAMKDGSILVEGNALNNTGFMMEGGSIHVQGDAGGFSGLYMRGGELHVDGNFDIPGFVENGRIFHKGMQVWPPGGAEE